MSGVPHFNEELLKKFDFVTTEHNLRGVSDTVVGRYAAKAAYMIPLPQFGLFKLFCWHQDFQSNGGVYK